MSRADRRRIRAIATLLVFPRTIRDAIVELPGFKEEYGIPSEAEITFRAAGLRFLRSKLFSAIRTLYVDRTSVSILATEDGQQANLRLVSREVDTVLECGIGEQTVDLPSFMFLSPIVDDRLVEFDRIAARDNLVDAEAMEWRKRLSNPLADEEFGAIRESLDANPIRTRQKIREEVEGGTGPIGVVVPYDPVYYDRLIGSVSADIDLESFVSTSCRRHIKGLLEWNFAQGLALALLIAGHSSISPLIVIEDVPVEEVEAAFAWLASRGNRFSQVAGVELGITLLDRYPGIESSLIKIVSEIRDDDVGLNSSRTTLAADLFILVSGELSRRGMLRDKPPFWRRLAAVAQSGMFERELLRVGVDIAAFSKTARYGRGPNFYLQALADLRLEPRWLPDFMSPEHLKDEFISRLVMAGEKLQPSTEPGQLASLLKSDEPEGLRARVRYPGSFLPGPLEGGTSSQLALPAELIADIRKEPEGGVLDSSALSGLVNASLVYRIEPEHSRLATEALQKVRHQVSMGTYNDQSFGLLSGLAVVAAVTRTPDLASDVRVLARVLRRRTGVTIENDALMRVGLVASAAHRDLDSWCRSVGEWFTELAYQVVVPESAEKLSNHLRILCEIEPKLWPHCAKADAALASAGQTA